MSGTGLMRAFHVGPEDIAANRAGRLGARQTVRLRRGVYGTLAVTAGLVGALVAIVLLVAHRPFTAVQLVVTGVVGAAGLAVGVTRAVRLRRAARDGTVDCFTGPVRVGMRGRAGWWLTVDGRSFHLPVRFWQVGAGLPYHVYVAPGPKLIVAMEPRLPLTQRPVAWTHTGDGEIPYRAEVDGTEMFLRVNDFPAEPLYSVLVDGRVVEDVEDWPAPWIRPRTPAELLHVAATAQTRRGRIDAIVLASWANWLCALPRGPLGPALGVADDRIWVSERHGDLFTVEATLDGAGPSRGELDALLGPGTDVVRVHYDQPHPVCWRVTVAGAPYTCDVFGYFPTPPVDSTRAVRVMLRRQVT